MKLSPDAFLQPAYFYKKRREAFFFCIFKEKNLQEKMLLFFWGEIRVKLGKLFDLSIFWILPVVPPTPSKKDKKKSGQTVSSQKKNMRPCVNDVTSSIIKCFPRISISLGKATLTDAHSLYWETSILQQREERLTCGNSRKVGPY